MSSHEYSLTDQLTELRTRIIVILLFLVAAGAGVFIVIDPLIGKILGAGPDVPVVFLSPPEIFLMKIKITLFAAVVITLPITALEVCLFVFPSLYGNEKVATLVFIIMTLMFAAGGAVFAYAGVIPFFLQFLAGFSHPLIRPMFDLQLYIGFLTSIILFFVLTFQSPVLFLFFGSMGIVNAKMLKKVRKYMYLFMLVISALITPMDLISTLILALPLILLYETGILIVSLSQLKKKAERT